ncbi:DUF3800 domain-containing protein [Defluviicoccus vanus]|uniref:DUF3800 domain-containing protein n=1 Tax=Defluviicoccus vanus TaxID=111831 RepID=A0A7H1MY31_9PROT|nr:DUF3800 domain-containing protein [Defluviicoccus vanus]QNT68367.1 DUF3800 domain-containing protein [Defluviicoccus vanus]
MDVNEIRDPQIQMFCLSGADNIYTFYHDETNNIRKLHIDDRGLNVAELKVFILGGIAHEGRPRPIDVSTLRQAMRIQDSADELKLKHVAKGEFMDIIDSSKLEIFLQWIANSGFLIHYHELDPLYWSVVDIIDSILFKIGVPSLIPHHALLKSDLAAVIRRELPFAIDLFRRYDYPGLASENRKPFLNELIELVQRNAGILDRTMNAMMLKGILQEGRKLEELSFIEGYPAHKLIEEFSAFYINRIAVFKNSEHIMDLEETIRDAFLKNPLTDAGEPVTNYRFADSKTETGIQLSDVIVGVLGKMHTYLSNTSAEDIEKDRLALSNTALKNTKLLCDLITAPDSANQAFLHHVASLHDIDKLDRFLRFPDGRYV